MNHRFIRNTVRALKMSAAAVIFAGLIGSPQAEVYAEAAPAAAAPAASVTQTQTFDKVTVYSQADSAQFLAQYAAEIENFKKELLRFEFANGFATLDSEISAMDLRTMDLFSLAFCDIDANGVPELIKLYKDERIYEIGTLAGGEYIGLTTFGPREWVSIASDGTIMSSGGGGDSGYAAIERISSGGRELERIEFVYFYSEYDEGVETGILYEVTDANGNMTSYTEEGYEQYDASKPKPVILEDLLPRIPLYSDEQIFRVTGVTGANLVKTMSPEEYRKLNEFFDNFSNYQLDGSRLSEYAVAEDASRFFVELFLTDVNSWVTAAEMEEKLNRFFGITKVNHEGYGWKDESDWHEGFYVGYKDGSYSTYPTHVVDAFRWIQVSMLTDNGDGTLTAVIDSYASGPNGRKPENWYEPRAQWDLDFDDARVIDGIEPDLADGYIEGTHAYRLATTAVTLIPYVYNGEQTWQITAINGLSIPKELFAE